MEALFSWFGMKPEPGAIMAWGARAIFKPQLDNPLDLLPDRQGHEHKGRTEDEYEAFLDEVNKCLPMLRKLSSCFESHEYSEFVWHFDWPYAPSMVLVARGSPSASYGYFYLAMSLVDKDKAPPVIRPKRYETDGEKAERRKKADEQWAKVEAERKERERKEREERKALRDKRNAKVESELGMGQYRQEGQELNSGDRLEVNANQAWRTAVVLAVSGEEALIKYFMPSGIGYMRVVHRNTHAFIRNASKVPKKFSS